MKVTKKKIAQKIIDYLYHNITLDELVDWAENAMMTADFEEKDIDIIRDITSRLGLSDVKAFGLMWEDCEEFLHKLGYTVSIAVKEAV